METIDELKDKILALPRYNPDYDDASGMVPATDGDGDYVKVSDLVALVSDNSPRCMTK